MSEMRELRCSKCGNRMLRKSGKDGRWRLSSLVITMDNQGMDFTIICKDCRSEEKVPVRLQMALPPTIPGNPLAPQEEDRPNTPLTFKEQKKTSGEAID